MYGVEAQSGGVGGLLAQTPYPDQYLGAALRIRPNAAALVGGPAYGTVLPYGLGGGEGVATRQVDKAPSAMGPSWRDILDWHSNPAPWVLLGILLLYAWLHVSIKASGSARIGR